MNAADREPPAQLSKIQEDLRKANLSLNDLLPQAAELTKHHKPASGGLRALGYKLVSLAGDLTRLGVDMAHWADELDGNV